MENEFDSRISDILLDELLCDIPDTQHVFSKQYQKRKKHIIRRYKNISDNVTYKTVRIRKIIKYAVIAAIIAALAAVGLGYKSYYRVGQFHFTPYGSDTQVYFLGNPNEYPQTLEKRFYLDTDMSGYEKEIIGDTEYCHWVTYTKGEESISICQQPVSSLQQGWVIGTENARTLPTETEIDGNKGFYFQSAYGLYMYVIVFDEYSVEYFCNADKESTENWIRCTKFE